MKKGKGVEREREGGLTSTAMTGEATTTAQWGVEHQRMP
jgi:hypothetical protein